MRHVRALNARLIIESLSDAFAEHIITYITHIHAHTYACSGGGGARDRRRLTYIYIDGHRFAYVCVCCPPIIISWHVRTRTQRYANPSRVVLAGGQYAVPSALVRTPRPGPYTICSI